MSDTEHPGRWPVYEEEVRELFNPSHCEADSRRYDLAMLTRDYILALEAERDEYKERAEKLFETYCQVIKMDTE